MAEVAVLIGLWTVITSVGSSIIMHKVIDKIKKKRKKKKEKRRKQTLMKKYIKRTTELKETSKKSDEICVICQDDFKEDNECSKLYCGHKYHKCCISEWIVHKKTCPLCNTRLKKKIKKVKKEEE